MNSKLTEANTWTIARTDELGRDVHRATTHTGHTLLAWRGIGEDYRWLVLDHTGETVAFAGLLYGTDTLEDAMRSAEHHASK